MRRKLGITLLAFLLFPILILAQGGNLISISPPNTIAGATDLPLTVLGTNFSVGASINWNGAPQSTNFISSTTLTTLISTALLASPGAASVSVTQSGIVTPGVNFQVLTPLATVISFQPTIFTPGTTTTITVYGQGFNPNATIFFDSFPVLTSFIDSSTLSGSIDGSNIVGSGPYHVYVYNATVPSGLPSLSIGPLLPFGAVIVGTPVTQQLNVTNISATSVTMGPPSVSGTNSGDFVKTGATTCINTLVLAPLASCQVTIQYTPSIQGNEIAQLAIPSNGAGSPQFTSLSGIGIAAAAPAPALGPTSLSFGNQQTTTTSAPVVSNFTNTGNANLVVSALSVTGVNSADFTLTGSCTSSITLNPGESCTLSVTFTPSTTSTESANVTITDNADGSPRTLPLSGTGTAVAAHFVVVTWTASVSGNLIGYNVYRSTTSGGPYTLLTPTPVGSTSYTDSAVTHGTQYFYVITAIGTNPPYSPVESLNSNQGSATP